MLLISASSKITLPHVKSWLKVVTSTSFAIYNALSNEIRIPKCPYCRRAWLNWVVFWSQFTNLLLLEVDFGMTLAFPIEVWRYYKVSLKLLSNSSNRVSASNWDLTINDEIVSLFSTSNFSWIRMLPASSFSVSLWMLTPAFSGLSIM